MTDAAEAPRIPLPHTMPATPADDAARAVQEAAAERRARLALEVKRHLGGVLVEVTDALLGALPLLLVLVLLVLPGAPPSAVLIAALLDGERWSGCCAARPGPLPARQQASSFLLLQLTAPVQVRLPGMSWEAASGMHLHLGQWRCWVQPLPWWWHRPPVPTARAAVVAAVALEGRCWALLMAQTMRRKSSSRSRVASSSAAVLVRQRRTQQRCRCRLLRPQQRLRQSSQLQGQRRRRQPRRQQRNRR